MMYNYTISRGSFSILGEKWLSFATSTKCAVSSGHVAGWQKRAERLDCKKKLPLTVVNDSFLFCAQLKPRKTPVGGVTGGTPVCGGSVRPRSSRSRERGVWSEGDSSPSVCERYEHSSPRDSLTTVHWTVVPQRIETLRWQCAGSLPIKQMGSL